MTDEEPTAPAEATTSWFLVSVPTMHEGSFMRALGNYPGGFSIATIREPTYVEEEALRFGASPEPRE